MSNARRKWLWCVYDNTPGVMVSAGLHHRFAAVMKRVGKSLWQGGSKANPHYAKEMFIDEPGMCATDRPLEEFDFLGLKLTIPSEDIASFIRRIDGLVPNEGWYELHGFHRCIVLTDWQRTVLRRLLWDRLLVAEQRAHVFWADKKSPGELLREIAAKASGQPLEEIPDLGGHKADRFIPKTRGAA